MSEAHEIAASLIAKHGSPAATTHNAMCTWLNEVWPDWREWIGSQHRDNIATALLDLES